MSRRRNSRCGRNEDRRMLLRKVVVLELISVLLVTLPLLVGGVLTAVGLCIAFLLQLDVACATVSKD